MRDLYFHLSNSHLPAARHSNVASRMVSESVSNVQRMPQQHAKGVGLLTLVLWCFSALVLFWSYAYAPSNRSIYLAISPTCKTVVKMLIGQELTGKLAREQENHTGKCMFGYKCWCCSPPLCAPHRLPTQLACYGRRLNSCHHSFAVSSGKWRDVSRPMQKFLNKIFIRTHVWAAFIYVYIYVYCLHIYVQLYASVCACVLKACKYAYNCKLIFQIAVSATHQCNSCHVATTGSATNNQLVITLRIFNLHCKAIIFLTFNAYSSKHFYAYLRVCVSWSANLFICDKSSTSQSCCRSICIL